MTVMGMHPNIETADVIFVMVIALLSLAILVTELVLLKNYEEAGEHLFPAAVVIGVISFALVIGLQIKATETRYDLFVSDDSIPYAEFCAKWRVLNSDGQIITAVHKGKFKHCIRCGKEEINDWAWYCSECGGLIRDEVSE